MSQEIFKIKKDFIRINLSNRILAKAARISEVTQIGKKEKTLDSFLNKTWEARKKEAIQKAVSQIKKTTTPQRIISIINNTMENWENDVKTFFESSAFDMFELGRIAGFKKATRQDNRTLRYGIGERGGNSIEDIKKQDFNITPSLTLADKQAIAALTEHQVFWIGKFYKSGLSKKIGQLVRETILETGMGSVSAGKVLRKTLEDAFSFVQIPKGFNGTPQSYFEMLSANTATVARVTGQLRSFAEIGITTYRISNPGDKRTCQRCAFMNGREFTVTQGLRQMEADLNADSPEAVKEVHPWLTLKEMKAVGTTNTALAKAGLALPTYHGKCRCTVDISTSSQTFDNLQPIIPPAPNKPTKPININPIREKIPQSATDGLSDGALAFFAWLLSTEDFEEN